MKRNLLLFLALLTLLSFRANAQELVLFEETRTQSYLVRYNSPGVDRPILNEMLTMIGAGNNKSPNLTEFSFQFESRLRLIRRDEVTVEVVASLGKFRFSGDVEYRHFKLDEVLLPHSLSANLAVTQNSGGDFYSQKLENVLLESDPTTVARFVLVDSSGKMGGLKLEMQDLVFQYGPEGKASFDDKLNLIEEYHQDVQSLKEVRERLYSLDLNDLNHLREMESIMDVQAGKLREISAGGYHNWIEADPSQDYRKVGPKLVELKQFLAGLRDGLSEKMNGLAAQFTDRGFVKLNAGALEPAAADFESALEADPVFAEAHLGLAQIDFLHENLEPAMGRLKSVLNSMMPKDEVRGRCETLALDIIGFNLNKAGLQTQAGKHENSLLILRKTYRFCQDLNGVACPPELIVQLDKAKVNLYRSYLQSSEDALKSNDLVGANEWVEKALVFQSKNRVTIPDPQIALNLQVLIKEAEYEALILEGKTLLNQDQYEDSKDRFTEARILENDFELDPDTALSRLEKAAVKPLILQMVDKAERFAKVNQLQQAAELRATMDAWRKAFGLLSDREITAAISGLENRIFNQECKNTQARFLGELSYAQNYVRDKKFLEAEERFNAALSTANLNPRCKIDYTTAISGKKKILPAVLYLKKREIAKAKIDRYRFEEALQYYKDAGNFFERENVDRFGLVHLSLEDYSEKIYNREFMFFLANHFSDEGKYASSMRLVRRLLRRMFLRSRLKPLQVRLGEAYAEADFRNKPGANYKQLVKGHIGSSRGLGKFKKAYKKRWKYLAKK